MLVALVAESFGQDVGQVLPRPTSSGFHPTYLLIDNHSRKGVRFKRQTESYLLIYQGIDSINKHSRAGPDLRLQMLKSMEPKEATQLSLFAGYLRVAIG